jgi:hypothetical protein
MTSFAYSPDGETGARVLLGDVTGKNGNFGKFELWFENLTLKKGGSGTFLIPDHCTAPDFHLWEMLDQYIAVAAHFNLPDPLSTFPHLRTFYRNFKVLPQNERYFASKLFGFPCNNKMARSFGATPSGSLWSTAEVCSWKDDSGIY